jgi:hypothetical protein
MGVEEQIKEIYMAIEEVKTVSPPQTCLDDDEPCLNGSSPEPIKLAPGHAFRNGVICPDMPRKKSSAERFNRWIGRLAME